MSRKLIFVSGLLTCFSCGLDESLQAKISACGGDSKAARGLNLAHLENYILQRVRMAPLDIVALAVEDYGVETSVAESLFSAYDEFLGLVGDQEKREHLKKLRAEASRDDPIFRHVERFSRCFEQALHQVFFENYKLKPLTQKYGVF